MAILTASPQGRSMRDLRREVILRGWCILPASPAPAPFREFAAQLLAATGVTEGRGWQGEGEARLTQERWRAFRKGQILDPGVQRAWESESPQKTGAETTWICMLSPGGA